MPNRSKESYREENAQLKKRIRELEQAIKQAVELRGSTSLKGLIHHSDRGVQYCCDAYVGCYRRTRLPSA